MTYNPAIPGPNDLISASQSQIQTNFSQANTAFAVDHVAFDVLANQGMHKQVTLKSVLAANPNQISPIASLYTKASPTTITSDLYYQDGALASNVKQITGGGITAAAWAQFDATTTTVNAGYNIATGVGTGLTFNAGTKVFTINFTRSFVNGSYAVLIVPTINSASAVNIFLQARNTNNCQFKILVGGVAGSGTSDMSALFFGVLA